MLNGDLAMLYQGETKRLNEVVKRNIVRFPEEFRFQLGEEELTALRSQFSPFKLRAVTMGTRVPLRVRFMGQEKWYDKIIQGGCSRVCLIEWLD